MEYKMGTAPAEWKPAPRVCRCCLSEGCYKDISTEYYWLGEKEMYSQMLKECFDLTISLSEAAGNSRLICEVCITRLRDASNFKKQVINSEKRFAEHLRSGASLSVAEVQETPVLVDIKVEGVKDEAAISDDDPDPVDDDIGDPDYDESDDLPLKFEVQKKESMTELSFGDEIPALNTSETTIRKVSSRTKEKSALKKLKMNKKELTIKPVKASTSKKKDKEAKVKLKATKPGAKKGKLVTTKLVVESLDKHTRLDAQRTHFLTTVNRVSSKADVCKLLEFSNLCPFTWKDNRYHCFCCEKTYASMSDLIEHSRHHCKEQKISRVKRLRTGVTVKVDTTLLACAVCKTPVDDIASLKQHLSRHHQMAFDDQRNDPLIPFGLTDGNFKCSRCSQTYQGFHQLNMHMNGHFPLHICETCGAGFSNARSLGAHKFWHKPRDFECGPCNIKFNTLYKKNLHMTKVHKRKLLHKCPICEERFKEHYARVRHLTAVHGASKMFHRCATCERKYSRISSLNAHIRSVHLNEKHHACRVCEHKFFRKSDLTKHMMSHGSENKYGCDTCGKSYPRKYSLTQHLRRHSESTKINSANQETTSRVADLFRV